MVGNLWKYSATSFFPARGLSILYGPPISDTSLGVLLSIVDFAARTGNFPNFEELRSYHFSHVPFFHRQDPETKSRLWASKDDSRYVTALYASLRNLERHCLIARKISGSRRKIESITPTTNGVLSVAFSDLLPQYSDMLKTTKFVEAGEEGLSDESLSEDTSDEE